MPLLESAPSWPKSADDHSPEETVAVYYDHPRPEILGAFFKKPTKVIELGCGTGVTGMLIKQRWPDAWVCGIEKHLPSLRIAEGRLDRVVPSPAFSVPLPLENYGIEADGIDTFIAANALEHLPDPWETLSWIRRYLAVDAQVVLSIPNVRNLWVLDQLVRGNWRYAHAGLLDVNHLRFFTKGGIEEMLAKCGLEIVHWANITDARLAHVPGQAGHASIRIGGALLEAQSPRQIADWKAMQFLVTARKAPGSAYPVSDMRGAAAEEDKQPVQALVVPTPSDEDRWREGVRLMAAERRWMEESAPLIRMHVVLAQSARNLLGAKAAMESVRRQILSPASVTVWRDDRDESLLWPALPEGWRMANGQSLCDITADIALSGDTEDWLIFVDSGDLLAEDALYRMAVAIAVHPGWRMGYSDEDSVDDQGVHSNPHFKPDFFLDTLRSLPYIGGLLCIRKDLFLQIGGFSPAHPGAEEYDFALRVAETVRPDAIGHVARVLYHRGTRSGGGRWSAETIVESGRRALAGHLSRCGEGAEAVHGPLPATYRVVHPLPREDAGKPRVTILIPTRDQLPLLTQCIESVLEKTAWPHFEIVIIDNGSQAEETRRYLASIEESADALAGRVRVFRFPGAFNYSAMHNAAVREMGRGEFLLFLNNDTVALHPEWLENMMRHALRRDVGAVGAKLVFPDGRIQHGGVVLGLSGRAADHPFLGEPMAARGYYGRLLVTQNYSAVTAACLLMRREVFEDVGGFDESLPVQFNDVDLCLRLGEKGLRVVWTPDGVLVHHGSVSQKAEMAGDVQAVERAKSTMADGNATMFDRWMPRIARDPAYNVNLSTTGRGFQPEDLGALSWQPEWRPRQRVLAHPVNREGTGEYRIIAPARALHRQGLLQVQESMRLLTPPEMGRMAPDSVVFQLQLEHSQMETIANWKRHFPQALRVFEADDLITNLPMKNIHRSHMHKDVVHRLRHALSLCHRMVVTTEPLVRHYGPMMDDVRLVPNSLERECWGHLRNQPAGGRKPRVGWAGGISHRGDLEMIADVVLATKDSVDWVFFGMCPEALKPHVSFVPPVRLPEYPARLASLGLDLAIAPLEINAFNEAKSSLRLLEYGVLGIPVLCTDILPYQGNFPIFRIKNRFAEWKSTILDLTRDREALQRYGARLREYIFEHCMLDQHLGAWVSAWTRP